MSVTSESVRCAIVLAAGNGDRFRDSSGGSKLLHPFLGQPLLLRTLATARDAGVQSIVLVIGYEAERVRVLVQQAAPPGLSISFRFNPDWRLENGVSVLAARRDVPGGRFALLMGDHLFDAHVLHQLLNTPLAPEESVLAVDAKAVAPEVAAEATKVRRDGSRIVAIGKELTEYDALDTGMFVCAPALFDALEASRRAGDTTLSGGVRLLAARSLMRGAEIGDALWCDIDTLSDLEAAEAALGVATEPA